MQEHDKLPILIDRSNALESLIGDVGWSTAGDEVIYSEEAIRRPSMTEVDTEVARLQAEHDANQYQRDRNYPAIEEQLDMLYWDKKNGTSNWEESIDSIKDEHPK